MRSRYSSTPTARANFGNNLAIRVSSRRISDENRERKAMHAATTRSIIAAAGLAAVGLAFWPQHATPQAQQGIPTVHHAVALVDATSSLLGAEGTFDSALWNDVLGAGGAEQTLYNSLVTAFGASEAQTLLDTNTANPVWSGDFNGAESRLFEGLYLDTLAGEDEMNQALGISPAVSEAATLNDWTSLPEAPLPSGDVLPVVGASGFDTDLMNIANGEFTLAVADFEGYLASFATDPSALGSLGTVFTDLGSSFSDLSNLSGDLSTILTDLGNLGLGGLI
jgi:hypothetical protein